MADELEMVTQSADGDSWVDQAPAAVSTGYQAQNTSAESVRVGMDSSHVTRVSDTQVRVEISGPIDDNGVLFAVKQSKTLTVTGNKSKYAIALKPGSANNKRDLELVDYASISYSAQRNCYLTGAENYRVLNWGIECDGSMLNLYRLSPGLSPPGHVGPFDGIATPPYGYASYQDVIPWHYKDCPVKTYAFTYFRPTWSRVPVVTGAMTYLSDTSIAYIRVVGYQERRYPITWGYSVLDLVSGQKTDEPRIINDHILSMYYSAGAGELVVLTGNDIRIYTGSRPIGNYRSFALGISGGRYIDVVDGDLILMRTGLSDLIYRFDGISSRVKQKIQRFHNPSSSGSEWSAGISHFGDRIILGLMDPDTYVRYIRFPDGRELAKFPARTGDLRIRGSRLAYIYGSREFAFIGTADPSA